VNFIKNLAPVELNIMCDAQRIRDALLNVITNAVEAMPSGGTLSLSSRKTSFEKMFFDVADGCRTGACALLTVSDTGSGMDSYTKEKVEEPFFTTKEGAKGLGFSVAARVIRGHDGIIGIDSSKGTGTTVSIYLPLLTPAHEQLAAIPLPSSLQESYESYRR
jgi:signal transduction histidine kinase